MPELPEVEVLVRHLRPRLTGRLVGSVQVYRARAVRPSSVRRFKSALRGAKFMAVARRGKYIVFTFQVKGKGRPLVVASHLGMTGRMYLSPARSPLPKHTPLVLALGPENFVFEDTRYFGRMTLDLSAVQKLGPEPLGPTFTADGLAQALKASRQPIKVKLLDQSIVAGMGNIYASEALFRAKISPRRPARSLTRKQVTALWQAIRMVLSEAIETGSTVPLDYPGEGDRDGLFYFGRSPQAPDLYEERLKVYDREGEPCPDCGTHIERLVHAARSTFYCPHCQR